MAKTRLQQRCSKVDPTYYLSNQGTGYTSLWLLITTPPSNADKTTSVVFPKGKTGYMKVIPGTQNKTILSSLPTTFDKYGWRSEGKLRGKFSAGPWQFSQYFYTGKYVTGDISLYVRLWKSPNPDGSNATPLTDWIKLGTKTSPSANATYYFCVYIDMPEIVLVDEYLFVEYAFGTTIACSAASGCTVTFECNLYQGECAGDYITTTAFTPAPRVYVVAGQFPMIYLLKPETAKELVSKVENVAVSHVANDFPEYLIQKGRASEFRSKWS